MSDESEDKEENKSAPSEEPRQEPPPLPPQDGEDGNGEKRWDNGMRRQPTPMGPRRIMPFWLMLLALGMISFYLFHGIQKPYEPLENEQVFRTEYVEKGLLDKCELVRESSGKTYIRGTRKGMPDDGIDLPLRFMVNVMPETQELRDYLREHGVTPSIVYDSGTLGRILLEFVPILVVMGLIWFFMFRQMRGGMGAANFGKSRARMAPNKKSVTFDDVAGEDEAKEEVAEVVQFLKDPKKFSRLGGRIPRGVLLVGPPGTGKTLLARAIAGEAGVPFFSISGSDFIEMFVGVGASRVRDMFDQGLRHAPCIIFIDEIDAVGRSRFSGPGGGHDEREQTLNQLLTEMDGFEPTSGVIVMAATNRPDVLDPALLRPGRFDRQVVVDLPPLEGRIAILKVHAKKIKLAENVDLERVARGTPGFSGADLANLLNEAALLAARHDKEAVDESDIDEARDKVLWGRERRSRVTDDEDRRLTAFHEAGHAVVTILSPESDPVHKVTIIPRGMSLGSTMFLPVKDQTHVSRTKLLSNLAIAMGGRAAEEIFLPDICTGASQDIKQATELAHSMICKWGMSEKFGPRSFGSNEEHLFLGREISRSRDYSEKTAEAIDEEVSRLLNEAHEKAKSLLKANEDKVRKLVDMLLEKETVDGRVAEKLFKEEEGTPAEASEG